MQRTAGQARGDARDCLSRLAARHIPRGRPSFGRRRGHSPGDGERLPTSRRRIGAPCWPPPWRVVAASPARNSTTTRETRGEAIGSTGVRIGKQRTSPPAAAIPARSAKAGASMISWPSDGRASTRPTRGSRSDLCDGRLLRHFASPRIRVDATRSSYGDSPARRGVRVGKCGPWWRRSRRFAVWLLAAEPTVCHREIGAL